MIPNDIGALLSKSRINRIFANGKKAASLYNRYILPVTGREITELPSTSPANARYNNEKLYEAWSVILKEEEK